MNKCRYCGCTEENACRLETGDTCCWISSACDACSRPACIAAEAARLRTVAAAVRAARPRRKRPWEVHEEIMREAREKRRRARKRRAA